MTDDEGEIRFAQGDNDAPAANDDSRLALLAVCVLHQQRAGFGNYIDLREPRCETCRKPGFNTGWGYWLFECGAEVLSDGTPGEPCPNEAENN